MIKAEKFVWLCFTFIYTSLRQFDSRATKQKCQMHNYTRTYVIFELIYERGSDTAFYYFSILRRKCNGKVYESLNNENCMFKPWTVPIPLEFFFRNGLSSLQYLFVSCSFGFLPCKSEAFFASSYSSLKQYVNFILLVKFVARRELKSQNIVVRQDEDLLIWKSMFLILFWAF